MSNNYTLGEAMDTIKACLENASDKVGAYSKEPKGLQDNEMGTDFENPDGKVDKEMGSNNDGIKNTFKKGDVEDSATVSGVTKESAMLEIFESAADGKISEKERDLFISVLK